MGSDRQERLRYILRTLIEERQEYRSIEIPGDIVSMQRLMRAMLNVRPPMPVDSGFIAAQDAELKEQLSEKGIVCTDDIAPSQADGRLRLWQGDITRLRVDAITNAANSRMLGCFVPLHGCIDNAIHSAAGVQLRLECNRMMEAQGYAEPTGRAKLTPAYNLPSRYVLHTVGPIVPDGIPTPVHKRRLAECYRSCLELADSRSLGSIAFCCISTGEFRYPNREAAGIAVATVTDYLDTHPETSINTVIFNVFKDEDYLIYKELLG